MLDKIKKIFNNKEKRVENLVSFLIILVITLIIINKILNSDKKNKNDIKNEVGVEFATSVENFDNTKEESDNLEIRLEEILGKIAGVGKVSVLLTYSESSTLVPIYNINSSTSTIEETDTSGGNRITETENTEKDVVTDSSSNVVTEKIIKPTIEGAIVTAQGASSSTVKSNIISAVEAVTGISTHKIQVFEMGDE